MIEFQPVLYKDKRLTFQPNERSEQAERPKMLIVQSAMECMLEAHNKPIPQMLFGPFWHEGEVSILFADSNVGKSLLAVQIADSISSGNPIPGFALNAQKQTVLYIDFELNGKQFEQRYSKDYQLHYVFDHEFKRAYINPEFTDFEYFERELFINIEEELKARNAKILIVDNLTYLKTQATDTSKEALPLMKQLKKLAHKYNLSILALAHTPKRNSCNPITMNDLAGSKMLSNFADSIFAIGSSTKDKSIRYIKQIKARATEIIHDSRNVILCEIRKDYNRTIFHSVGWGDEKDHLQEFNSQETDELEKRILELKREQNLSYGRIAEELGTNKMKVMRVLKKHGYSDQC